MTFSIGPAVSTLRLNSLCTFGSFLFAYSPKYYGQTSDGHQRQNLIRKT